ncbi:MAG TPA: cell wall hydrolase [Clostridiales bacterium]|nr:MAG: hypothetical protein A2Y22_08715 [Clostridiales bacterium GWD2_32_59]HAN09354.1 cell wall hydrolase [Clostridiales bacterium]
MSKKIIIDPGHYKNCPNKGRNGYNEGNGVFKISTYLKQELDRHGFVTILTRQDTTQEVSLTTRGKMAAGADLFISEHSNANDGTCRGVEVFYSIDLPDDKILAGNLSKSISSLMGNINRGAKIRESTVEKGEDYYTVIDTAQDVGCKNVVLVENGFHDNLIDEAFLLKDNNLKLIAKIQAKVICDFFGVAYVEQAYTQLSRDIDILASAGIIDSPEYWKRGSEYKIEYVQALIHKVAGFI